MRFTLQGRGRGKRIARRDPLLPPLTPQVDDCVGCRIIIGPCAGSVFVRDCKDCDVYVASQQLRTRNCERINFRVFCATQASRTGSASPTWTGPCCQRGSRPLGQRSVHPLMAAFLLPPFRAAALDRVLHGPHLWALEHCVPAPDPPVRGGLAQPHGQQLEPDLRLHPQGGWCVPPTRRGGAAPCRGM